MNPPVFGITGWKNSGKTTLAAGLIRELTHRGYSVTALKHAHESFDIDQPGRDSFKLRAAGARRVVLSSPKRWAVMQELRGEPEAPFEELLAKVGPCAVVVVEGFKNEMFPKLEIRREGAASREPLISKVPSVVAIASDHPAQETDGLPVFHIDDVAGIASFVISYLKLARSP
jgi:molybdopterin-guanine dinucleotide biosynthesis adapter protein